MENYFNYFTEIEDHFRRRRGTTLLLTTLDWALIETWKDASIPLEAALRGIDAAFDRYDQRPSKTKKVNSLAFCTQEVMAAAEEMKEAAVGAVGGEETKPRVTGFESHQIAAFLAHNAERLEAARLPQERGPLAQDLALQTATTLRELAAGFQAVPVPARLEDLERRLTVLEEKLFAALLASIPDEDIVTARADADRELAPYRRKMTAPQIEQLQKQYVYKRLLEEYGLPRLSLFYL